MTAKAAVFVGVGLLGAVLASPLLALSDQRAGTTPAAKPGSLVVTVSSTAGEPLSGATVTVLGGIDRAGTTGADGTVTLQGIPVGAHRVRIAKTGFFTFEKEVAVKAPRTTTEAALTAAPPPPPAPAPAPPPVAPKPSGPTLAPGSPRIEDVIAIFEGLERDKNDKRPIIERDLGCSGATASRLIFARGDITDHNHADADEVLYVVAGEATLKVGDRTQNIGPGGFSLVPRGTSHTLTRRGRNPMYILSVQSGPPCSGT